MTLASLGGGCSADLDRFHIGEEPAVIGLKDGGLKDGAMKADADNVVERPDSGSVHEDAMMPEVVAEPPSCSGTCTLAMSRCHDGSIEICRNATDNCPGWEWASGCSEACDATQTACAGCIDACSPGVQECTADGRVRQCEPDQTGCFAWGPGLPCVDAVDCTADACNPTTDKCEHAPTDSLCGGTQTNMCQAARCDPVMGCQVETVDGACDDSDLCTIGDRCTSGVCAGMIDTSHAECVDACPTDDLKRSAGMCGCGVLEEIGDQDGDGIIDCMDNCPNEPCATAGASMCENGWVSTCTADANGCLTMPQEACGTRACYDDTRCAKITYGDLGASVGASVFNPNFGGLDDQGNAFTGGTVETAPPGTNFIGGRGDAFVAKWTKDAELVWVRLEGSGGDDVAYCMAVNAGGRVAMAGDYSKTSYVTSWMGDMGKSTAPAYRGDYTSGQQGHPREAAFGPGGDLYVVGSTRGAFSGFTNGGMEDAYLVRLNPSTGALVWAQQWGGTENEFSVAVSTDGTDMYVGWTEGHFAETVGLQKRASDDGRLLWSRTWSSQEIGVVNIARLATDPRNGDVVMVAEVGSGEGDYSVKLSPGNVVKWSYGNSAVGAGGLAIDDTGAIYTATGRNLRKFTPDGSAVVWDIYMGEMDGWHVDVRRVGGELMILVTGREPGSYGPMVAIVTAE